MTRQLRALLIGDGDHYLSPYLHGVANAAARLGILTSQIGIRAPLHVIERRVVDVAPHVVFTHMLLWPPPGAPPVNDLLDVCVRARRLGARVVVHDGDIKAPTRFPHDISPAVDLALVNHAHDRSAWGVETMRWPYAAFDQDAIAPPDPRLACSLAFAGQTGGGIYHQRTAMLASIPGVRVFGDSANTLLRTPEIAASADAVLGFGRPDVPGWVDTRVFQYIPAGAILLHDDVGGHFEPWVHFAPYEHGSVASIRDAMDRLRRMSDSDRAAIRERGFADGQASHSYSARTRAVIERLGLK